jgi:hypothetical protein
MLCIDPAAYSGHSPQVLAIGKNYMDRGCFGYLYKPRKFLSFRNDFLTLLKMEEKTGKLSCKFWPVTAGKAV